jgi:23S rRNA (cytosine1962-C5)-methyltransferase
MLTLPTVTLKPGEADRVAAGHPWIYAGSVWRVTPTPRDGEIVQVKDSRHRFLGVGFYNSRSKIHVRLLDPQRVQVNEAWFEQRLRAAWELRRRHLPQATSLRVVNAESDFLSGLIVDKYEDHLVLQISSLGMDARKEMIVQALRRLFSPRAIVERSETAARKFEGLDEAQGTLWGEPAPMVWARLNGLEMAADLQTGHKTGLYLDQQVNYELVGRISVETVNVFDWLKAQTTTRPHEKLIPRYDVIILDPPSFTRTRASVPDALRGYKEIHLRALKLLKPGGTLVTFCCSHHVPAPLFQEVITAAAADSRRVLRRVAIYTQSPDHPVLPVIPETEYLKGFAFEVAR